uniref:Pro-neuregulin-4, membrane-bound isoform n=1 Tax=Buteo japonicus TaxID=224669 RepID=A0A8B9Z4D4_9AVES
VPTLVSFIWDHEELCGTNYGSFCLNGGICYMIPTVSSPFCRCIENYTGARCEEVLLPSIKSQTKGDLFAAFLASLLLLGVLVIGAFYFFSLVILGHHRLAASSSFSCAAFLLGYDNLRFLQFCSLLSHNHIAKSTSLISAFQ